MRDRYHFSCEYPFEPFFEGLIKLTRGFQLFGWLLWLNSAQKTCERSLGVDSYVKKRTHLFYDSARLIFWHGDFVAFLKSTKTWSLEILIWNYWYYVSLNALYRPKSILAPPSGASELKRECVQILISCIALVFEAGKEFEPWPNEGRRVVLCLEIWSL